MILCGKSKNDPWGFSKAYSCHDLNSWHEWHKRPSGFIPIAIGTQRSVVNARYLYTDKV
jgi:hypothetical protein